jgi:hypothetical protein
MELALAGVLLSGKHSSASKDASVVCVVHRFMQ